MRRVAVRGIAFRDGKLLCVKLRPYNEMAASGGGWWCLPGGTVDEGEALVPALEREIYEETGIKPRIGKLLYVHQFMFKEKENMEFFFHIQNHADFEHIDLSKTSHGAEEIEKIEFVDTKTTVILPKFLSDEPLETHISGNSEPKILSFVRQE